MHHVKQSQCLIFELFCVESGVVSTNPPRPSLTCPFFIVTMTRLRVDEIEDDSLQSTYKTHPMWPLSIPTIIFIRGSTDLRKLLIKNA